MDDKQLKTFLTQGYISVNKLDNGEFTLRSNVRGLGGGPVASVITYWGIKGSYYGGLIAGAWLGGPFGAAAAAALASPTP